MTLCTHVAASHSSAISCSWSSSDWQSFRASFAASDKKCADLAHDILVSVIDPIYPADAQGVESAGAASVGSSSRNPLTQRHRMALDEACNILNVRRGEQGSLNESALQEMLKVSLAFILLDSDCDCLMLPELRASVQSEQPSLWLINIPSKQGSEGTAADRGGVETVGRFHLLLSTRANICTSGRVGSLPAKSRQQKARQRQHQNRRMLRQGQGNSACSAPFDLASEPYLAANFGRTSPCLLTLRNTTN